MLLRKPDPANSAMVSRCNCCCSSAFRPWIALRNFAASALMVRRLSWSRLMCSRCILFSACAERFTFASSRSHRSSNAATRLGGGAGMDGE